MGKGRLRIGGLAARLGVSTHALRVWESRYGLFEPPRSPGGYRQYDVRDVRRGELMCRNLAAGHAAGEAARLALDGVPFHSETRPALASAQWLGALLEGCRGLDEPLVSAILTEASRSLTTAAMVDDIAVPLLRAVTPTPEGGFGIGHAHFTGHLLRTCLLSRHRRDLPRDAPRLWLACPERELHDLGLLAFGLVAAEHGCAVRFFGATMPIAALTDIARVDPPSAVVLAATRSAPLRACARSVAGLRTVVPTFVAGPAAHRASTYGIDAPTLTGDIVSEARAMATRLIA